MTRAATEATESDLIQILTPDGQRHSHETYDAYLGDVDDQMLRGFYRDMAMTRRFDQEATALQRQGVESKLLVFPDENHWVLKPANSVQWHHTVNGWLDRFLKTQPAK